MPAWVRFHNVSASSSAGHAGALGRLGRAAGQSDDGGTGGGRRLGEKNPEAAGRAGQEHDIAALQSRLRQDRESLSVASIRRVVWLANEPGPRFRRVSRQAFRV